MSLSQSIQDIPTIIEKLRAKCGIKETFLSPSRQKQASSQGVFNLKGDLKEVGRMSGMTRRESASMAADGMNTTQGGVSTIDGDGQIKPKKREKKQILPPYKNKTAPFEFIRLLHRTKEMKEYSD